MTFKESLEEELKDPEVRAEYEALEPEYQIIRAILHAREEQNLSQRQLSERTGIAQTDISRIETGEGNPTLKTLNKIAHGMGMRLKLEFLPDAMVASSSR